MIESRRRAEVRRAVEEAVRHRLSTESPYAIFRNVTYNFEDGLLTLRGEVPSFYVKQILQTRLRDIDGVSQIDNQVEVPPTDSTSSYS